MDPSEPPRLEPAVSELVALAEKSVQPTPPDQLARRWAKLRLKLARAGRPRRLALAPLFAAAVLLLAVGGAWHFVRGRTAKLTYDVDGGAVVSGGLVKPSADEGPTLRFSDGTNVALASRTKMRLLSTEADGPKVAIDDGEARVRVFHREGTRWLFDAGPFTIVVKGTSFVVRWSESDKWLRLYLKSGSVAVSGPLPSGELMVREGQELSVRLREGEIVLRDDEDARALDWDRRTSPQRAAPEPPPMPQAGAAQEPAPAAEPLAAGSPRARREEGRNWSRKLAQGKVKQILEEALPLGDAAFEEGTSADLDALGDAARYTGKEDLARRAYLAQRRRFANGARATRDAYLLGRLDEAAGRSAKALEWFDEYLREAPSGTYASEALGGKMGVLQRIYGNDRARAVAEEYLRRFPGGSYSAAAQALTARP
jgi:ferric-dicitrate binding protein FerR (iron transport regulator)